MECSGSVNLRVRKEVHLLCGGTSQVKLRHWVWDVQLVQREKRCKDMRSAGAIKTGIGRANARQRRIRRDGEQHRLCVIWQLCIVAVDRCSAGNVFGTSRLLREDRNPDNASFGALIFHRRVFFSPSDLVTCINSSHFVIQIWSRES